MNYNPLDVENTEGILFMCTCADGFSGNTCARSEQIVSSAKLSLAASLIIILALLLLIRKLTDSYSRFLVSRLRALVPKT